MNHNILEIKAPKLLVADAFIEATEQHLQLKFLFLPKVSETISL